jgi:hypothetical protein
MNKTQLRDDYISNGWEVQPVANWRLVSSVEGKNKYDINAVSPDNKFGTAQCVVTDDGGPSEEAIPLGFWVTPETSFNAALRTYLDTLETGDVFATAATQVFADAEVAEVNGYKTDGSVAKYCVKRRSGTFSAQLLT